MAVSVRNQRFKMNKELKQAIVNYMFDNQNVFGLLNATSDKFKAYMFDDKGEWLIGGEQVSEFIRQAEKLVTA